MAHYMILGYGGIGQAVVDLLLQQVQQVSLVSNKNQVAKGVQHISFNALAAYLNDNLPDYIINTIGLLHDEQHQPEKTVSQMSQDWLEKSMAVNVMTTVNLLQQLEKVMQRRSSIKILCLSARVSSISDNQLGGWHSYRMSKAALNMLIKNVAIDWQRRHPQSIICGYHPGTVDTPLSKPFQTNIPEKQLFSAERAAMYLLDVLHQLSTEGSGKLFDWQGKVISP